MKITLVCNPENRRAELFRAEATARGAEVDTVAWLDVLAGDTPTGIIRVESPGENWAVENALLQCDDAEDRGRIRGLGDAKRALDQAMRGFDGSKYMNSPASIGQMFDKHLSKARLSDAGIFTPETLGLVRSFDELRTVLGPRTTRCFVKPRHGSSASGVIALTISTSRVLAITSVEHSGGRLYNSLKIRRYNDFETVAEIVDLLGCEDELLVERWVPKATAQGGAFDLRVVAVADQAQHAVMRVSKSPMTNLHLGNARGDIDALRRSLGDKWQEVEQVAVRALRAFDGALYAGVDIGLVARSGRLVVFEVNAFGDLLPGIVDAAGRSTYGAQLDAFMGS